VKLARASLLVASLIAVTIGWGTIGWATMGCASVNGFDPSKAVHDQTAAAPDPEVEPLQPTPKRRMRDPRGVAFVAPPPKATIPMMAPPAVDSAAAGPTTCGTKAHPCPMQRFMHLEMETAHTADTLATAFSLVAGMSPDPSWAWVAIATRGSEKAIAGDIPAAKAQCTACHEAYREAYKKGFRARAL
jgi:hypothetical protein